ncbi:hypothetical protein BO85DRAFT_23157 [Aspergillus piperis CBS 112811]|uniref:Uncharacterized protein n=1 Tax=Aspergillus piperis CBS 112811 TaxID=1448313 RepID=A0A8G1RFD9_9EURO|nr:hypothetical protein BO85DRAFT_23157 [Aspergillus piperis CBS 112811]RAH63405.1 hypothetical protein BO85DRAFT_23157 [Aspergillus piperis CBS 112811]
MLLDTASVFTFLLRESMHLENKRAVPIRLVSFSRVVFFISLFCVFARDWGRYIQVSRFPSIMTKYSVPFAVNATGRQEVTVAIGNFLPAQRRRLLGPPQLISSNGGWLMAAA